MRAGRIFLSPPHVGDAEAAKVGEAFASNYIAPCGPMVDEFESRLARLSGRKYAVAVSSATAGLELLCAHLGVDSSWAVIAPTLTFIATVGPAYRMKAEIRFVDCGDDGNVDLTLLEKALSDAAAEGRRTLFIGVDLYGRCCDYDAIDALCGRFGAVFLSDSAEAVGATYKGRPSGSAGLAAVYSFNGNKIITTSGGGAVLTDCRELADHVRKMSMQSRENAVWYEHREVGYNFRMSNILAAVGLAQLDALDAILAAKSRVSEFYRELLSGTNAQCLKSVEGQNNWLFVMLLEDPTSRDALLRALEDADIESRPVWKPMHLQEVFAGCRVYGGAKAEELFARGLCLPSGAGLDVEDLSRIGSVVGGFVGRK